MARLNRRDFLKALGLGGTVSAAAACGLDDNRYLTPVQQLLPYVVKNEVHTPGTPTFFASTITTGPCAFPVTVRHRDGRVVNVGSNERAPLDPAVPLTALLALQRHYSPDRFRGPRVREGNDWTDTDWQTGTERLATAVQDARSAGKKVAYLGPYRSGSIVELLGDYTQGEAVFWEPLGPEAQADAAEILFGERMLPAYDLSEARYVLSFGAAFLSGQWGNTALQSQYARAVDPNHGHFVARTAVVAPHMDQTAGNADDWYPAKPGSEALVARAVARLIADKTGYEGPALELLAAVNVGDAAAEAGLDPADIDALASQFVSASQQGGAVALPGGAGGASRAAVDLALAACLINIVSGNAGKTFGTGRHYAGPIHGYDRVKALLDDMKAGNVGVLLLDDANPAYSLPADAGVAEALAAVDLVVGLSSHPDETNASAHLVLPTSSAFEDWGDEEPQHDLLLLRQPGMTALHDTRSLGDILLVTARAAGLEPVAPPAEGDETTTDEPAAAEGDEGDEAAGDPPPTLGFTPETWRDYVKARWERDVHPRHQMGADLPFDDWWHMVLEDGFLRLDAELQAPELASTDHAWSGPPSFDGDGEFHLHLFPHPILGDGRFANEPWAQEAPDPITGQTWDSWVEIAPATADRLGLSDNDLVEVTTSQGTLALGVDIRPGVRDDVLAIAFGQGHTALGRYAGFGVNVVELLSAATGATGTLAWQQARASLTPTGAKANLTTVLGHDRLEGRHLAPQVPAKELAEVGDEPSDHPGELTGIHHLERDERLKEAGILDFYEAPDHPVHRWAMTVDTNACNGCGACSIACYAENNLPVVGKDLVRRGKEMNWLRVNRYWSGEGAQATLLYQPMMCQQCTRAPCESVCPVLATYHNHEGLNAMVYNRCVGTRYCANNCPYQVRRFNFHSYQWPEPFNLQLNPDVVARTMGVMEKCTFCVQRTRAVRHAMLDQGASPAEPVPDEHLKQLPACAEACPTQAITFGNLLDEASTPSRTRKSARNYLLLEELRTEPAVNYLAKASHHVEAPHHGAAAHGDEAHGETESHEQPAPHGAGSH